MDIKDIDKFYTNKFNSLPYEKRKLIGVYILQRQILDYKIEKNRAIAKHSRLISEIDSHIANCEKELIKEYLSQHPIKEPTNEQK